LEKILKIKP